MSVSPIALEDPCFQGLCLFLFTVLSLGLLCLGQSVQSKSVCWGNLGKRSSHWSGIRTRADKMACPSIIALLILFINLKIIVTITTYWDFTVKAKPFHPLYHSILIRDSTYVLILWMENSGTGYSCCLVSQLLNVEHIGSSQWFIKKRNEMEPPEFTQFFEFQGLYTFHSIIFHSFPERKCRWIISA